MMDLSNCTFFHKPGRALVVDGVPYPVPKKDIKGWVRRHIGSGKTFEVVDNADVHCDYDDPPSCKFRDRSDGSFKSSHECKFAGSYCYWRHIKDDDGIELLISLGVIEMFLDGRTMGS